MTSLEQVVGLVLDVVRPHGVLPKTAEPGDSFLVYRKGFLPGDGQIVQISPEL